MNVAVGDVTGDGVPDLITVPAAGGPARVRVFDGLTGNPVAGPVGDFVAFTPAFAGGATVAAGDVNRDGTADIVVGAGAGGGPAVQVFDGKTGQTLASFFAYDPGFRGGVAVAAGSVVGDDRAEVVTGAGPGGGPHVRVFDGTGAPLASFYAYDPGFRGGVHVAAGSRTGAPAAAIVTGAGPGGGPAVELFDETGAPAGGFFAGDPTRRDGVSVAVRYSTDRPAAVIAAGAGSYDAATFAPVAGPAAGAGPVGGAGAKAADAVRDWAGVTLQSLWATSTPAPQAARALGTVGAAMFDAVNSVTGGYQAYKFPVPAAPGASADAAAAVAAARTLEGLFPARTPLFEAHLAGSLADVPDPAAGAGGRAVGEAVAAAMIAWRKTDGSTAKVPFTPGAAPGDYRPTPPAYAPALDPQWPAVTPFAMTTGSQFRPGPPPALDSAQYATDLAQVQAVGGATSAVRTPDQTLVAHFWSDLTGVSVTPPGHWWEIALRVSGQQGLSLTADARLFGALGVALADAAVVSWDAKYLYHEWRPVTAIQQTDPAWAPLWPTPNFPSYTSGHSTFSGAAGEILGAVFGADTAFTASSDDVPGVVRAYASFAQAADEAGESRIYGGIHFESDNQAGLASGRALGQYVAANFFRPE